jgi:hypothetical protein
MEGDDLGPEDRQFPRIQFNRCQPRSQVRWAFCDDLHEGGQGRFLVQDGSWTRKRRAPTGPASAQPERDAFMFCLFLAAMAMSFPSAHSNESAG